MKHLSKPLNVPAYEGSLMLHQCGNVSLRQKVSVRAHASRRICLLVLGIFAVLTGPVPVRAQQDSFSTIDVPGASSTPSSTQAAGINTTGQIVGWYVAGGQTHGFLRNGGNFSTIDVPGAFSTQAAGINDAGQIVGSSATSVNSLAVSHGFLRDVNGNLTQINFPGASDTFAWGINNVGEIVGWYVSSGRVHGFLLAGSSFSTIDVPGAVDTQASGINNVGQIVGDYTDSQQISHGFLLDRGSFRTIDIPESSQAGTFSTVSLGINDASRIVGVHASHGFLWDGGNFTLLDVPGANSTEAAGINSTGQIVGWYGDSRGVHGFLRGLHQTVFLIHGILQSGGEQGGLQGLAASLRDPTFGIDQSRFQVDAGFDFGNCAGGPVCDPTCTIGGSNNPSSTTNGARKLAQYINNQNPVGDIILVGYSLGGLIARDMMLHNFDNVLTNRKVAALITIGTPHLGYPYLPKDNVAVCQPLADAMFGDFRNPARARDNRVNMFDQARKRVAVSRYLYDLNTEWGSNTFVGPDIWVAMSGTFCTNNIRNGSSNPLIGCSNNTKTDGVVCNQSANFLWDIPNGPTTRQSYVQYSHTTYRFQASVFCAGRAPSLDNPRPNSALITLIRNTINGLPSSP